MENMMVLNKYECEEDYSSFDEVIITAPGLQQLLIPIEDLGALSEETFPRYYRVDDEILLKLTSSDALQMLDSHRDNWGVEECEVPKIDSFIDTLEAYTKSLHQMRSKIRHHVSDPEVRLNFEEMLQLKEIWESH